MSQSDPPTLNPLVDVIREEVNRALDRLGIHGIAHSEVFADGLDKLIRQGLMSKDLSPRERELIAQGGLQAPGFMDTLLTARVESVVDTLHQTLAAAVPSLTDSFTLPLVVAREGALTDDPEATLGGAEQTLATGGVDSTLPAGTDADRILLTNRNGVDEMQTIAAQGFETIPVMQPGEAGLHGGQGLRAVEMGQALQLLEEAVMAAAPEDQRSAINRGIQGEELIGTLLGGKYQIEEQLGRGGFGTVYRAKDVILGARVAIKVLNRAVASRQRALADFLGEAQRLTTLDHENIVRWITFDRTDDGLHYFVMEYLEGRELRDVLAEQGPMDAKLVGSILLQTLKALECAHEATRDHEGLLHLDLKPQNVFVSGPLDAQGVRVKVIDFGISQHVQQVDFRTLSGFSEDEGEGDDMSALLENTTSAQAPRPEKGEGALPRQSTSPQATQTVRAQGGTPLYASPEQCAHLRGDAWIEPLDGRSDIYSLGIVGFKALTGQLPFDTPKSPMEAFRQHLEVPPKRIRELSPKAPRRLASFVERCLEKQVDDRWQSATEARRALESALAPVVSKPSLIAIAVVLISLTALIAQAVLRDPPQTLITSLLPLNASDRTQAADPVKVLHLEKGRDHEFFLSLAGQKLPDVPDGPLNVFRSTDGEVRRIDLSATGLNSNQINFRVADGYSIKDSGQKMELVVEWPGARLQMEAQIYSRPNLAAAFVPEEHLFYRNGPHTEWTRLPLSQHLLYDGSDTSEIGLALLDPEDLWREAYISLGDWSTSLGWEELGPEWENRRLAVFSLGSNKNWKDLSSENPGAFSVSVPLRMRAISQAGRGYDYPQEIPLKAALNVPALSGPLQYKRIKDPENWDEAGWLTLYEGGQIRVPAEQREEYPWLGVRFPRRDTWVKEVGLTPAVVFSLQVLGAGNSRSAGLQQIDDPTASPGGSWVALFSTEKILEDMGNQGLGQARIGVAYDSGITAQTVQSLERSLFLTKESVGFELEHLGETLRPGQLLWVAPGKLELGLVGDVVGLHKGGILLAHTDNGEVTAQYANNQSVAPTWTMEIGKGVTRLDVAFLERTALLGHAEGGAKAKIESHWPVGQAPNGVDLEALLPTLRQMVEFASASTSYPLRVSLEAQVQAAVQGRPTDRPYWNQDQLRSFAVKLTPTPGSAPIASAQVALLGPGNSRVGLEYQEAAGVYALSASQKLGDGEYRLMWMGHCQAGHPFTADAEPPTIAVNTAGPDLELISPSGAETSAATLSLWPADPNTYRYSIRAECQDDNGLNLEAGPIATIRCDALPETVTNTKLKADPTDPRIFRAKIALPEAYSNQSVRIEITAQDKFGLTTELAPVFLRLAKVQRPIRNAVTGPDGYPMQLVRGASSDYPFCAHLRPEDVLGTGEDYRATQRFLDSKLLQQAGVETVTVPHDRLLDFYLGTREVSNKEFTSYLLGHTSEFPEARRRHWTEYFGNLPEGRWDHPVEGVLWAEANGYALSKGLRLPTALEWEYAVRMAGVSAGSPPRRYAGRGRDGLFAAVGGAGPFSGADPEVAFSTPTSIHYLCGNVSEWTSTPYWRGGAGVPLFRWDLDLVLGGQPPAGADGLRYMVVGGYSGEFVGKTNPTAPPHDYRRKAFIEPDRLRSKHLGESDYRIGFRLARDPIADDSTASKED